MPGLYQTPSKETISKRKFPSPASRLTSVMMNNAGCFPVPARQPDLHACVCFCFSYTTRLELRIASAIHVR